MVPKHVKSLLLIIAALDYFLSPRIGSTSPGKIPEGTSTGLRGSLHYPFANRYEGQLLRFLVMPIPAAAPRYVLPASLSGF